MVDLDATQPVSSLLGDRVTITLMVTKLDIALMTVPLDIAATLVALGADQALIWTGSTIDRDVFFTELGRSLQRLTEAAWDRKLDNVDSRHRP